MPPFEQVFGSFIESCARIFSALMPLGMAISVCGFIAFFWRRPTQPAELVQFLVKLFLIVMLISYSRELINTAQEAMDSFVTENVPARPENVAQLYADKLAQAQNAQNPEGHSFLSQILGAGLYESIVYALLTAVSWVAMAILFYINLVQKVCLFLCWSLIPVIFPCFAIPQLAGLAWRHALRILGILLWPLGIALAATVTEGLIGMMTDQSFLVSGGLLGTLGYGLQSLFAVALIGIWVLASSVAAPLYVSRILTGTGGTGGAVAQAGETVANTGLPLLTSMVYRLTGHTERRSAPETSYPSSTSLMASSSSVPPPESPAEAVVPPIEPLPGDPVAAPPATDDPYES